MSKKRVRIQVTHSGKTIQTITDRDDLIVATMHHDRGKSTPAHRQASDSIDEALRQTNEVLDELIRQQERAAAPPPDPPAIAELLLTMFLKSSRVDGVAGDLREQFNSDLQRIGRRRAFWRYWRRTGESLWPLLRRTIIMALKWSAAVAAVKHFFGAV